MDSHEILRQYFAGAFSAAQAAGALGELAGRAQTLPRLQEGAKARCGLRFLARWEQYRRGEASRHDLCLCLGDLLAHVGRLRVSQPLYDLVGELGGAFDLHCERDCSVSRGGRLPDWLPHGGFAGDVFRLAPREDWEPEKTAPGDLLLQTHTIFRSYKSFEQKLAVRTALSLPPGHTLLLSLPTGGGKSLVTQLLAATGEGLTLVIVPTVALALDQYHGARASLKEPDGIFSYRGDQSEGERQAILRALEEGSAKLLFTSPEAVLKNSRLFALLEEGARSGYLSHVVVDEAHIVPDWGVFFRPDFQIFSVVLQKWRRDSGDSLRTCLLSATLSEDVVDTLFSLFGEEGRNVQVRCDALRREPRFYFHQTKTREEQAARAVEAALLLPKPMVLYLLEPKEAEALRERFEAMGFRNVPTFTGKTKDADRDAILEGWKRHQYDLVIATSAFGIGVDKPDVRTILHACVPENLSRFYQEVGRGGRDGLPSLSLLLPCTDRREGEGDLARALGLVNKRVLRVENMVNRWLAMLHCKTSRIEGDSAVLDISATPSTMSAEEAAYAGGRNMAWNVNLLLFLHRAGFIALREALCLPGGDSCFMIATLLRPRLLGDGEKLAEALEIPRQEELDMQLGGYRAMRALVQKPGAVCWGKAFQTLFPLARESCNGCPVHREGNFLPDSPRKLRRDPGLTLPPGPVTGLVKRKMGRYQKLIIREAGRNALHPAELGPVLEGAAAGGIGAFVLPEELAESLGVPGLLLTHEEFRFVAAHAPYLLAAGVLCVFGPDPAAEAPLLQSLERLDPLGYRQLLYCREDIPCPVAGKPLRETVDIHVIDGFELVRRESLV